MPATRPRITTANGADATGRDWPSPPAKSEQGMQMGKETGEIVWFRQDSAKHYLPVTSTLAVFQGVLMESRVCYCLEQTCSARSQASHGCWANPRASRPGFGFHCVVGRRDTAAETAGTTTANGSLLCHQSLVDKKGMGSRLGVTRCCQEGSARGQRLLQFI